MLDKLVEALYLNNHTSTGSNTGPEVSALLSDRASNSGTLHLTLGVSDNAGVILEVEENAILPAPGAGLTDNNCRHDLLSELGLTLLNGSHDHVSDTSGGKTVQTCTNALDGNNVKVTGTGVVGALHNSADRQTQRDSEL